MKKLVTADVHVPRFPSTFGDRFSTFVWNQIFEGTKLGVLNKEGRVYNLVYGQIKESVDVVRVKKDCKIQGPGRIRLPV